MRKSKSNATPIHDDATVGGIDRIERARQAGYDAGYEDARSLGGVDVLERIEKLERRHNAVSRTVGILVSAALEDASKGLTPEQMSRAQQAGVEAMLAAVDDFRAKVTG